MRCTAHWHSVGTFDLGTQASPQRHCLCKPLCMVHIANLGSCSVVGSCSMRWLLQYLLARRRVLLYLLAVGCTRMCYYCSAVALDAVLLVDLGHARGKNQCTSQSGMAQHIRGPQTAPPRAAQPPHPAPTHPRVPPRLMAEWQVGKPPALLWHPGAPRLVAAAAPALTQQELKIRNCWVDRQLQG